MKQTILFITVTLFLGLSVASGQSEELKLLREIQSRIERDLHRFELLEKKIDDVLWFQRVGDVAFIDKVRIVGPPRTNIRNPNALGFNNPLRFPAYVFIPRNIDVTKKYPLIVLIHGGVHGNFSTTSHVHMVRELLAQGYVIVAPEYRGSNGYGETFWRDIDYGGFEVQDSEAARAYMVENYSFVDANRVGAVGWSHGGMIALMSAMQYPKNYSVVFAGVPVSCLVYRMGYQSEQYRRLFSDDYHIGQTVRQNIEEYRRRSPTWNAHLLQTPTLITATTNDDDVHYSETMGLINALKAHNKKFEYKIYENFPSGHSLERLDIKEARQARLEVWQFLARHLRPPTPMRTLRDMERAAYVVLP
jgi:dipeptidyl aminopeptidase/acylaminoacyl peptidase